LLLGVVFIAALAGLVWVDYYLEQQGHGQGLVLVILASMIAGLATAEYLAMVRIREPLVPTALMGLNMFIVFSSRLGTNINFLVGSFVAAFFVLVLIEFYRYDKETSKHVIERLALGVFGIFYIGLLMGFVVRLRMTPYGLLPLVSMLVIVKLGDTGAYTVGRLIGKHKLCPKLSPGKTIEGLVGAMLFGLAGAAAIGYFWGPTHPLRTPTETGVDWSTVRSWMIVGPILALVGAGGDLVESLLKRDYGRKDSSDWMPGFGGVLDLIDSPLIAAPVAFFLWEAYFIVPGVS